MLKASCLLCPLIGLAAMLSAQTIEAPDTFKVTYFSNANSPGFHEGMVRITNAGTQVGSPSHALGYLCAMIYVSDENQQLHECCGCPLPPDSLRTLSINANLTSNPLTPVVITSGDIKIVSSFGTPLCDPRQPVPAAGIRAWATHIQGDGITETEFEDSSLNPGELSRLVNKCSGILNNGSGFGICWCGALTGKVVADAATPSSWTSFSR
jgi:hypothetical protein